MSVFETHLTKISSFLNEYEPLIDSHLVDFITRDLWSQSLPQLLRIDLETLDSVKSIGENREADTPELDKFLESIDSLSLEKCDFIYQAKDLPDLFSSWGLDIDENLESDNVEEKLDHMNEKKSHEVEILAKVVSSLAKFHSSIVVDAGAGKGYLSEFLSQKYKIPVLAIDSSPITHQGAVKRQNIIKKNSSQSQSETLVRFFQEVRHLVQRIDDSTDFSKLAENYFPGHSSMGELTITGLHTCGFLGQSVLKSFIKTDCIKSLCVVPCCYHLSETSCSGKIGFSKNAKMLAQQSVDRINEKEECFSPSLHYRAVLQLLMLFMGLEHVIIGRGAPLDNFSTYAKWALLKIAPDPEEIPEDENLEKLYRSHEDSKLKMELFQALRVRLGSVVESAILLDRMIYLEKSKVCSKFALVQLFDPVISPRCYAIIALK